MQAGTNISVKNLFFNVPARRNFLKSNPIEARHIIDEFERVALAHPEIAFSLNMNNIEHFRLPVSNLRQRIVNIYGKNYNERLVPIAEETTLLSILGFVGKPEYSRKTRGEQFLFVNKRYIKDGYLNHAVGNAFAELLPKDSYASYWLYIDIDPAKIDVNIHPTKTEIKFEDERSVYPIVRAAVKRSLGQYNVAPALDFERERSFDVPHAMRNQPVQMPTVVVNPGYNPFQKDSRPISAAGWDKVYEGIRDVSLPIQDQPASSTPIAYQNIETTTDSFFQIGPFLIAKNGDQLLMIDATAAHERIIYNQLINKISGQAINSQQMLFPQTIQFNSSDIQIIKEIENEIRDFGFDISEFGLNTYVLNAAPVGIPSGREKGILEDIIEQYKNNSSDFSSGIAEKLARSMSKSMAVRRGDQLLKEEIHALIEELMKAENNDRGIDGKPCMKVLKTADLADYFK